MGSEAVESAASGNHYNIVDSSWASGLQTAVHRKSSDNNRRRQGGDNKGSGPSQRGCLWELGSCCAADAAAVAAGGGAVAEEPESVAAAARTRPHVRWA